MKRKKENYQNNPQFPEINIIDLEDPDADLTIESVRQESFSNKNNTLVIKSEDDRTQSDISKATDNIPAIPDQKKEEAAEDAWDVINNFETFPTDPDISFERSEEQSLEEPDDTPAKHMDSVDEYLTDETDWVTEDWEQEQEQYEEDIEDENEQAPKNPVLAFFSRINWHIVFAVAVLIIIGLVVYRFKTFGKIIDLSQIEGKDENDILDSILPLIVPKDKELSVVDDGITTIVAFGNAPFADDRDSSDNLASLIAEKSGATVYNCSVEGSYLTAKETTLLPETEPLDAFNFYWLTTLMCLNDDSVRNNYQRTFASLGDAVPDGAKEAYNTLTTLDFNKVDVVTLMYDGSDYLDGRDMYDDVNPTNIQTFTGNMEAGIELIQNTYPHIRIIVLSPAYVFAVDENGEYVPSDLYRYGQDVFSTYVIKQFGSAYTRSVSFVDNLYGTITADNAGEYLTDNIHLNIEGRKLVADRFVQALNYYNKKSQAN